MRLLLDEGVATLAAHALVRRGHVADLAVRIGLGAAPDEQVIERAGEYDALVTLDIFRQEDEFRAACLAMLGGLRIVRVRQRIILSPEDHRRAVLIALNPLAASLRDDDGVRLIIVDPDDGSLRTTDRDGVAAMLLERG